MGTLSDMYRQGWNDLAEGRCWRNSDCFRARIPRRRLPEDMLASYATGNSGVMHA